MRGYELTRSLFCTLLPVAAGAHAPAAAHAPARQEPAIGGDFELNDSRGKPFRLSSQCGKAVPIFFGYTGYPDVCPTDLLPLTGSEAQLRRVAKAYGTHFSYIGRTTGSNTYTVDHPANLYVVDATGKLARILPYGTPTADLIKAIAPMIE